MYVYICNLYTHETKDKFLSVSNKPVLSRSNWNEQYTQLLYLSISFIHSHLNYYFFVKNPSEK